MCSHGVQLSALILCRRLTAVQGGHSPFLRVDVMQYTAIYLHLGSSSGYLDTSINSPQHH
jgi:hypothetical protein